MNEGFVQILHVGYHWVTISTIGCVLGEVNVFDSSSSPVCTSALEEQIAALLCTSSDTITLRYVSYAIIMLKVNNLQLHFAGTDNARDRMGVLIVVCLH